MNINNEIKGFREYVVQLTSLLTGQDVTDHQEWKKLAIASLNGEPGKQLRRIVDLNTIKESGAFFTSSDLANRVLSSLKKKLHEFKIIFDPSCGVGDLLISIAWLLPLEQSVHDTCRAWGKRLAGYDKHIEFVNSARLRLSILAAFRHDEPGEIALSNLVDYFPLISCADFFLESDLFKRADAVIVNPPFSIVNAPVEFKWATGGVNMAAVFLDKIIRETQPGTHIVSILPDVLRSGTRYSKWRKYMEESAKILSIQQHGLFDRWTGVDVFSIDMVKAKGQEYNRKQQVYWIPNSNCHKNSVGDFFEVHVGPVVPNRHREKGPTIPFIHARCLPKWRYFKTIHEKRRFKGTTFESPFVAVRRTSSPSDKNRAIGTIVTAPGPIAVENHIIILRPKDARLETCRQLISVLQSEKTDKWLNERIRCRHLTVSSLRELPWLECATS